MAGAAMGDRGAAEEIRAAGAVVWRPAGMGARVALVHRPKYDDWSLPKGKLYPSEHVLLAAVREVAEETALRVTLGRRLPAVRYADTDVPKRVDYWVATVAAVLSEFEPNSEVDEVAWVAASTASHPAQLPARHRDDRRFPVRSARDDAADPRPACLGGQQVGLAEQRRVEAAGQSRQQRGAGAGGPAALLRSLSRGQRAR